MIQVQERLRALASNLPAPPSSGHGTSAAGEAAPPWNGRGRGRYTTSSESDAALPLVRLNPPASSRPGAVAQPAQALNQGTGGDAPMPPPPHPPGPTNPTAQGTAAAAGTAPRRLRLAPSEPSDDEFAAMTKSQRDRHVRRVRQWRAIQWSADLNSQAQRILAAAAAAATPGGSQVAGTGGFIRNNTPGAAHLAAGIVLGAQAAAQGAAPPNMSAQAEAAIQGAAPDDPAAAAQGAAPVDDEEKMDQGASPNSDADEEGKK
jgi:hypothetical protein